MFKRFFQNKRAIGTGLIVLAVVVAAAVFLFGPWSKGNLSIEEASTKSESFINDFLMPSGSKATVSEVTEEYGLYKMIIDIGSESPVESYVTKDGRLFFPQAIDMDEMIGEQSPTDGTPAASAAADLNIPKNDKPVVELFVMSYCPYGTQIEKGMLPVLETLGDKIDFKLKFVDYIMHDKEEIDENLVQYCIQKEQPKQLVSYLQCFLADGDTDGCLSVKGMDKGKVESCVAATDKKFSISDNYTKKVDYRGQFPGFNVDKEDNEKYGVGGSPTLVINGLDVSSGRDSATLLATICSAFEEAPAECEAQLNSQSPTPGFGFDYNAASTDASCN
ncbi:hypothetical protein CVU83_01295 [Candidatus Falkowbacteria bacterium HGW-Falkowbacteria-2]|uniref:Thioredoxin-like fold domain-containing protein n=1 Tax=Candidatus Falkowbacteria bacterium HGW-Falkowbacteria-2 TaxID=2013769 RepID=A0A2N2E1R7_9BACT|nr:MAG: hypothetical protein CVU83_01295 [Candidatus Falkowbacteria bacterium HGW-Falkowbacteria-2]